MSNAGRSWISIFSNSRYSVSRYSLLFTSSGWWILPGDCSMTTAAYISEQFVSRRFSHRSTISIKEWQRRRVFMVCARWKCVLPIFGTAHVFISLIWIYHIHINFGAFCPLAGTWMSRVVMLRTRAFRTYLYFYLCLLSHGANICFTFAKHSKTQSLTLTANNDTSGNDKNNISCDAIFRWCVCMCVYVALCDSLWYFYATPTLTPPPLFDGSLVCACDTTKATVQIFAEQLFPPFHTSLNASQLMEITIRLNENRDGDVDRKKKRI